MKEKCQDSFYNFYAICKKYIFNKTFGSVMAEMITHCNEPDALLVTVAGKCLIYLIFTATSFLSRMSERFLLFRVYLSLLLFFCLREGGFFIDINVMQQVVYSLF